LKLESFPALAASDLERKQALLRQAEEATVMTRLMCDLLVGAALSTTTGRPPQEDEAFSRKRGELWRQFMETYRCDEDVDSWRGALEAIRPTARQLLDAGLRPGSPRHRTFHWPLEFPEVFVNRDGFDAIVGDPPFIGGQGITGVFGQPYRDYLIEYIAAGQRGSADYVAYFFLRAEGLLKTGGTAGLLATNTIAQGFPKPEWRKPANARNEALDARNYAYAALYALYASGLKLAVRCDRFQQMVEARRGQSQTAGLDTASQSPRAEAPTPARADRGREPWIPRRNWFGRN
jgi:hypothetical protein